MLSLPPIKFKKFILIAGLMLGFFCSGISLSAQQSATYEETIAQADNLFKTGKYIDAKAYYQMALRENANDAYAKSQITEIVSRMKGQMAKEDEYYDVIDLADVLYDEQAYDKATEQYRKALQIIPGDDYAKEKIAEINQIYEAEKEKLSAFILAMSDGNTLLTENKYQEAIGKFEEAQMLLPERTAPAEKIELARQMETENASKLEVFEQEVEEAGRYLLIKNYAVALEHFEKAQALFPSNTALNAKIEEILPLAENQQKYNKQVEEADNLYISKDFITARSKYDEASKTWPENSYPADMISRIDEQLADQRKNLDQNYQVSLRNADSLFNIEEFQLAKADYNMALTLKPAEAYPKNKIAEIDNHFAKQQKAFEADYSKMVSRADSLFDAQAYNSAKEQYEFALTIKPDDPYPQQKLTDIETQIGLIAAQNKLDATYQEVLAEADQLYQAGHYDLAIAKYSEASTIKSTENYPALRITAIREMIMNAEKQRELDENYSKLMVLGARLVNEDKLEEARNSFQNASEIKPYEEMPKQSIHRIDSTITARIQAEEIQVIYLAHIKTGDSLIELKAYSGAILAFEKAIAIKPSGKEADEKLLAARKTQRNYERAMERQAQYDEAIRNADKYFNEKNYELAQIEYQKATEVKSDEAYPKQQLTEIGIILKRLEAEKEERFNQAIVKADNFFEQSNYSEAVIHYKIAKSIKPGEQYPQQQIEKCNTVLAEELRRVKSQYDLAIADADKLYASKIYDRAISAYQKAEGIKPDETYPQEMVTKITSYIEENAITDIVKDVINISSGVTEKFDFEPIRINIRKSNYVLVKARNVSGNDFKIIFTYGSKKGKNGGFVLQVPQSEEYNDYIIRVGNQYKWFSEDNDWLSIYPENGDIEIKLVRISTGD